jgi:hypothetical protein
MPDVEHHAHELLHRRGGVGVADPGLLRELVGGLRREQIVLEIGDRLVGRLEVAARLRLEAQRHRLAGVLLQLHQVRHHVHHVVRVRLGDVGPGAFRLETERRALNRRVHAFGRELRQQIGHLLRVFTALRRVPVRLVHVFLDDLLLEHAVDERVGRVEIEVLVLEELLQVGDLRLVLRQHLGRRRRRAQADTELLRGRKARLHRREVRVDALPELLPVVGLVNQRGVGEVAEALAEIHAMCPSAM